ncbi:MAG: alpha/beta fold hydrolase, partial [Candidatus Thorarchaeota archaeon]
DEFIEDMFNLVMQIKDRFRNKLVFLFGHSLGGQHVIRYVSTYPEAVDGMILSCPGVSQTLNIGLGKRIAGEILSMLNVKRYFSTNMDHSFSSHDPEFVRQINEDPLMLDEVTARFGIQGLKAMKRAFKVARFITLPALVQQAGDDKYVDADKTKEFFDALASPDKTWRFYEGFYHSLHNELEKERVLSDMETWLEKRLPS